MLASEPRISPPLVFRRYRTLLWVSAWFLLINLIVRACLVWYEGGVSNYGSLEWTQIFGVGLLYDLAALSWLLIPFSLMAWLAPRGPWGRRIHAFLATSLFAAFLAGLVFQSVSEFIFWNEFSSRFNFIAVDYLVYTREVIGNIQESYPIGRILAGVAGVASVMFALSVRPFWRAARADVVGFGRRTVIFLVSLLLPALFFIGLGEGPHHWINSTAVRELASNGSYGFFRAFRNNELSYSKYYLTYDVRAVSRSMHDELEEAHEKYLPLKEHAEGSGNPLAELMGRHIPTKGPPIYKNVILVSIESLGSDYVDAFDGHRGLTPNLDRLAKDSLIFTNVYATGLRTVRGLEALTLSLPPTPGRAVPIRERNKGLETLGGVLEQNGYEAMYIYGGYSMFDNMNDFFSGNGYEVIDRTDIADKDITHETIWGVADEDLYRLALKQLDQRAARKQRFFAHIMTTSNHRPFTYPEGRVSIPSHSGRDGAVQYTDWAIGQFMAEARKRPWYKDTVFIFVADHTSHGRGRIDLPPENYRIPLIIHAPGLVKPGVIDDVASQIDVAPTLLSLLNIEYDSRFFGQDILHEAKFHPRAFMANYLTVGHMEDGYIVELGPRQYVRVVDEKSGRELPMSDPEIKKQVDETVAYYQAASAYIDSYTTKSADPALHETTSTIAARDAAGADSVPAEKTN